MSEKHIHSYSSPYNVGHAALGTVDGRPGLFDGEVFIQEKVDGSQLSFRLEEDGEVYFRSRKQDIYPDAAGMFEAGVKSILERKESLHVGYTYRGEYLSKPKHNCLPYTRVPYGNIIIFDIERTPNIFLSTALMKDAADYAELEVVPLLYTGKVEDVDHLKSFLDNQSILGGPIEGIVIKPKNHALWGVDKKVLMAKYVREDFKEKHEKNWKQSNPTKKDMIQSLIETYRTPQRWNKAVQHLKEADQLEGTPRDIGKLFKEVPADILSECGEEIKAALFKHFWKDISRGCTAGLATWYKNKLVENEFEQPSGYEYAEGHPALTDPEFKPPEKEKIR